MAAATSNINNEFFAGSYKDVWKYLIPDGLTQAETDFIIDVCMLKKDDHVLDIMCGYGRHAIELAKREISVTALDNLGIYTEEIQKKAEEASLPINVINIDVLEMAKYAIYDAALCMGNSFAFFNKSQAVQLLKNINANLKIGGTLIINSWVIAEIALRHFRDKEWYFSGPYKCLIDSKYLINPARIETEQTIIAPDNSIECIKGIDYIFSLDDMSLMAEETGFKMHGLFSTPRQKKFTLGDNRIYMVFRKNADLS